MSSFEIIGHRGAKGLAPENTIKSVRRAMTFKPDMIEVDVRLHKSEVVMWHDPIKPTSRKKYDLLEDALTIIDGRIPLNIEIKDKAAVEHLPKILKGYEGRVVFSSFDYKTLKAIKKLFPRRTIAVVEKWSGVRAITEATRLGTKRVHMNHKSLWSGFVRSMKHRGYKVYAYTVNSRDRAEELQRWGVDGIFTDYPSLFED